MANKKIMNVKKKLVELLFQCDMFTPMGEIADHLIANGVTVQEWIPASEPPQKNGYYLCVVLISACGNKKKYRRKILYWEDNVWIEKSNSFRIEKPLHWMHMAEIPLPEPPEEEENDR